MIEKLLKLLVTIVNAKLFKTIDGKVFKASNIENSNIIGRGLKWDTLVYPIKNLI